MDSALCQTLAISAVTSIYHIIAHYTAKRHYIEQTREYARLAKQVKQFKSEQNEEMKDVRLGLIQLRINVGILTDEMESEAKTRNQDLNDVFDEIDCLAQLIRAVGDSGEIELKDNQSRIDLVQRDTQNQLVKLASTVDRLRNILMSADKLKLKEAITEAEQEATRLDEASKEKEHLETELGQGERSTKRQKLRERIAALRNRTS